jgi:hypothetical protein
MFSVASLACLPLLWYLAYGTSTESRRTPSYNIVLLVLYWPTGTVQTLYPQPGVWYPCESGVCCESRTPN